LEFVLQLRNQFLIAMPNLADPNFNQSLTLICEHNSDGALGFVVNKPSELHLFELLEQQQLSYCPQPGVTDAPLYWGGPVEMQRGFILHSAEKTWHATMPVSDEISITSSIDIIEDTLQGKGPEQLMYLLGYAGWGAGQLEQEIADNSWLTVAADSETLFTTQAEQRWEAAASKLGVDLHLILGDAGHA
jgi:putative transcriptional regulator